MMKTIMMDNCDLSIEPKLETEGTNYFKAIKPKEITISASEISQTSSNIKQSKILSKPSSPKI